MYGNTKLSGYIQYVHYVMTVTMYNYVTVSYKVFRNLQEVLICLASFVIIVLLRWLMESGRFLIISFPTVFKADQTDIGLIWLCLQLLTFSD